MSLLPVLLALMSAVVGALGLVIQKRGFRSIGRLTVRSVARSRDWMAGLLAGLASFVFYYLAMLMGAYLPVQLVANTSPVFAMLFGYVMLSEELDWRDVVSLLAVMAGLVLVAVGGSS
jgi:drug/metabolite transporter (DMT)-like permease